MFMFMFGCWLLVVLRINVDLAIFQPYLDLEAVDNLIIMFGAFMIEL